MAEACTAALSFSEPIDPMAAIDRLGWTGPIAIAETSARSCATPLYVEVPGAGGGTPYVFEAPGSPASQAAWVAHTYHAAVDRDALFYVHAFLRDYPPIGTWIAEQGILAPELQSLLNTWPCSGTSGSERGMEARDARDRPARAEPWRLARAGRRRPVQARLSPLSNAQARRISSSDGNRRRDGLHSVRRVDDPLASCGCEYQKLSVRTSPDSRRSPSATDPSRKQTRARNARASSGKQQRLGTPPDRGCAARIPSFPSCCLGQKTQVVLPADSARHGGELI